MAAVSSSSAFPPSAVGDPQDGPQQQPQDPHGGHCKRTKLRARIVSGVLTVLLFLYFISSGPVTTPPAPLSSTPLGHDVAKEFVSPVPVTKLKNKKQPMPQPPTSASTVPRSPDSRNVSSWIAGGIRTAGNDARPRWEHLQRQVLALEGSTYASLRSNFDFQRALLQARKPSSAARGEKEIRPHQLSRLEDVFRTFPLPIPTRCHNRVWRPDAFCVPNIGRDWPRGARVFPLPYALPERIFLPPATFQLANGADKKSTTTTGKAVYITGKTRDVARIVPRDKSSMRFDTERSYREELQSSYYCITYKKGGWDALRHYEVIAAGCMPWFLDIEGSPVYSLWMYPKALVWQARQLPGLRFNCSSGMLESIDHAVFPHAEYLDLLHRVMAYGKRWLSTKTLARYVMWSLFPEDYEQDLRGGGGTSKESKRSDDSVNASSSSLSSSSSSNPLRDYGVPRFIQEADTVPTSSPRRPRKVLYIARGNAKMAKAQGNYNSWTLMHGLRSLLGPEGAVDSHVIRFLYGAVTPTEWESSGDVQPLGTTDQLKQTIAAQEGMRHELYGKGFGYAFQLPLSQVTSVNRNDLPQRILKGEFDAVIYGDPLSAMTRSKRFDVDNLLWFDAVKQVLPKHRIAFVHATDIPYAPTKTVGYALWDAYKHGIVLQREVPDCRFYFPPTDDVVFSPEGLPPSPADDSAEKNDAALRWGEGGYSPTGVESMWMKRCIWYRNKNCFDDVNVQQTEVERRQPKGSYLFELPEVPTF